MEEIEIDYHNTVNELLAASHKKFIESRVYKDEDLDLYNEGEVDSEEEEAAEGEGDGDMDEDMDNNNVDYLARLKTAVKEGVIAMKYCGLVEEGIYLLIYLFLCFSFYISIISNVYTIYLSLFFLINIILIFV